VGEDIKLVPGAHWMEAASGTNAIGTALASGRPVQISAAEHFCEGIKNWTCSATVVRDPLDGRVIGVLDISGLSGNHNQHCMALAVAGAGRIEAKLAALEMEKRARLLDLTIQPNRRWSESGIIILDRRGRLVRANENAGVALKDMGLSLDVCEKLHLDGSTMGQNGDVGALPQWLRADWVEPVLDCNERLGTLLAIPMPRFRAVGRDGAAAAQTGEAGGNDDALSRIIGTSSAMIRAKDRARQLSKINVPVLLQGPTGAGKEVFARALHDLGPTSQGPFIPFNCGGITRDLLASELFGYIDGAFTGAKRGGMIGKFEAANGGTLFLDEIGEMPIDLQPHFLRVLEEGEVYRLGENKPRKVSLRLVAATNRDLRTEVAEGRFRMDLFYRLSVTVLRLPGLSDRKDDIPVLMEHFIDRFVKNHGIRPKYPSKDVLDALMAYSWPGNVRELRNVVEGMMLLGAGDVLTLDDLPPEILDTGLGDHYDQPFTSFSASSGLGAGTLDESERATILAALSMEKGNMSRVAERLGIARSTLYQKIRRYEIDRNLIAG
jgi:transcriptional regulator of acetoin/glycerol metabolism